MLCVLQCESTGVGYIDPDDDDDDEDYDEIMLVDGACHHPVHQPSVFFVTDHTTLHQSRIPPTSLTGLH